MGELAEEILGKRVSDRFEWKCVKGVISSENHSMKDAWVDVLRALLPQIARVVESKGQDAFYEVPRSAEKSKEVANQLKADVASLVADLENRFYEVRRSTTA